MSVVLNQSSYYRELIFTFYAVTFRITITALLAAPCTFIMVFLKKFEKIPNQPSNFPILDLRRKRQQ